jgi:hypothetical protein
MKEANQSLGGRACVEGDSLAGYKAQLQPVCFRLPDGLDTWYFAGKKSGWLNFNMASGPQLQASSQPQKGKARALQVLRARAGIGRAVEVEGFRVRRSSALEIWSSLPEKVETPPFQIKLGRIGGAP